MILGREEITSMRNSVKRLRRPFLSVISENVNQIDIEFILGWYRLCERENEITHDVSLR